MTNNDLFTEFPPISKTDWLRQIAKDLKDKPLEDLNWQLANGLEVSPFVHADDFTDAPSSISTQAISWQICEDVVVQEAVTANRQAIEALEGGAEALCFWVDNSLEAAAFEQLLAGIHLDFIGLHFAGRAILENPGMVFMNLEKLAKRRGLSTTQLRGSIAYDPLPVSKTVDWRYLAELIEYAREQFPNFKLIQVSATEQHSEEELLRNANTYLTKLSERGVPVGDVVATMQFAVLIGKSYFLEIARLRAIKLLWFNVLKAWDVALQLPVINARFQAEGYSDELYTNMIRATTMAMSAVQGGAQRLTVLPYDAGREAQASYPPAFARRIARNVQHLLKMESNLDQVPDPAAGSYYIETLTRQIAEKAWEKLQV